MTDDRSLPAEQRLYDAVARWNPDTGNGMPDLIDAACQALVEDLDSPALRELAGASPRDRSADVGALADGALDELGIPRPGTVPPGYVVAAGGGVARRAVIDTLRLAVAPAPAEAGGGFQVEVYVNGTEMTSAGAGLGMDPYDLIVATDRLRATPQPHTVPIARCRCGVYGCGSTDVVIVSDGDLVHWDWLIEVPMARGVSFAADRYSAEVERVGADHSWETAERTAGRLVRTHLDREALQSHGLAVSWVANDYRDPRVFRVALKLHDDYQIFVDTPWRDRSPEELADEVRDVLGRHPAEWRASWHAIKPSLPGPPPIAPRSWKREQFR
ncbi:hypothetical protein [Actinoplanes sp. NPDC026619]|uniref:hypothetical protein n=1 Tax=Actinoplanes sp. NPDC026619 TaxID=3155798 RepID=UPI0033E6D9C0